MSCVIFSMLLLAGHPLGAAGALQDGVPKAALSADDACSADGGDRRCALNALQRQQRANDLATLPVSAHGDVGTSLVEGLVTGEVSQNTRKAAEALDLWVADGADFLVVLTYWDVAKTEDFEAAWKAWGTRMKDIEGAKLFQLLKNPRNPDGNSTGQYGSLELYTSKAAFAIGHMKVLADFGATMKLASALKNTPSPITPLFMAPVRHTVPLLRSGNLSIAVAMEFPVAYNVSAMNDYEDAAMPFLKAVDAKEPNTNFYSVVKVLGTSNYYAMEGYPDWPAVLKEHVGTDWLNAAMAKWTPTLRANTTIWLFDTVGDSFAKPYNQSDF